MDSRGRLYADGQIAPKAALLEEYERLVKNGFRDLHTLSMEELTWLQGIHDKHLKYYMEERRMHFGAFALVGLVFVILFVAMLVLEQYLLLLAAVEALLFLLLVPYVFVYRRYEEGVRLKMRQSVILENERRLRREAEPVQSKTS